MSLDSIKQEIQKSLEAEKVRLQVEWENKKQTHLQDWESQYAEAKDRTLKLIDKEEQARYTEELLSFKMEEKKRLLEKRKVLYSEILERVVSSLKSLLGQDMYYQFIKRKVDEFSSKGDTIYLSSADKKAFGDQLIKEMARDLNIKERETLKSGVVIEKNNFNYNFSSEALLEEKRIDVENFLGKKLYDEN